MEVIWFDNCFQTSWQKYVLMLGSTCLGGGGGERKFLYILNFQNKHDKYIEYFHFISLSAVSSLNMRSQRTHRLEVTDINSSLKDC